MQPDSASPGPLQTLCRTLLGFWALALATIALVIWARGYPEPKFMHILLNPHAPLAPERCPTQLTRDIVHDWEDEDE